MSVKAHRRRAHRRQNRGTTMASSFFFDSEVLQGQCSRKLKEDGMNRPIRTEKQQKKLCNLLNPQNWCIFTS